MSDLSDSEEPPRLGGTLLSSARGDAPSSASRARVAATLGVGVGAAATVATTKAAAAAVATAEPLAGAGVTTGVATTASALSSAGTAAAAAVAVAKGAVDGAAASPGMGTAVATAAGTTAGATGVGAGAGAIAAAPAKIAVLGLWAKVVGAAVVTLAVGGGVVVATADPPIPPPNASTTPTTQTRELTGSPLGTTTNASESARARHDEIPPPEPLAPPPIANFDDPSALPAPAESALRTSAAKPANPSEKANTAARAAAPPTANDEPSPLAREVRAIDLARSALVAGQPRAALMALDQHDRDFPNGPMRTEADVLRVDALEASGDHAAAKRLASQLLARDPSGAHARHLRSVAGDK